METISKSEMLAKIVESGDKPFHLQFVRATGKDAGSIRSCMCYYGAPNPKDRQAPTGGPRKPRLKHLETNSLPLTEFNSRQMLTPLISHIITFNHKKVIH